MISIVIPTFRRPEGLSDLLTDLTAQAGAGADAEIIVVDNDADRTSEEVAGRFPGVRYIVEDRRGVANARNTGVAAATHDNILFIDDDQLPSPEWLAGYVAAAKSGRKLVFGPVTPLPDSPPAASIERQTLRLFSRDVAMPDGADVGRHYALMGTGNAMFHRSVLGPAPFSAAYNDGGEDAHLIARLALLQGETLYWNARSPVWERVPADRMNNVYLRRRMFVNGQIRARIARDLFGLHPLRGAPFWAAVGLAQAALYGAAACISAILRRRNAEDLVSRVYGGLGKFAWLAPRRPAAR